jgi:hypothetical protein
MNSNNRTAATLYSLGDIVCLRNISINTLHKENDDDDDDNNNNNNKHISSCLTEAVKLNNFTQNMHQYTFRKRKD